MRNPNKFPLRDLSVQGVCLSCVLSWPSVSWTHCLLLRSPCSLSTENALPSFTGPDTELVLSRYSLNEHWMEILLLADSIRLKKKKEDFIYWFLKREREGEREGEKQQCVVSSSICRLPGVWPTTQACALTWNGTSNLLVHRPALNPLSHTSQDSIWLLISPPPLTHRFVDSPHRTFNNNLFCCLFCSCCAQIRSYSVRLTM